MSSGAFTSARYESLSGGLVYPCRVQPETLGLTLDSVANESSTDPLTPGISRIRLRKGKREFGPTIRTVTIEMTADGTGEAAYLKTGNQYRLPVMTNDVFDAYAIDQTGTYQGVACKCVNKDPE